MAQRLERLQEHIQPERKLVPVVVAGGKERARAELAAAWASFMFLYVYVDILGIYMPGVVADILASVVWEFRITQTWAVVAVGLEVIVLAMILRVAWTWPRVTHP